MDGFTGYHRAASEALPQARAVMDPFHVVHLAAEKVTACRQRILRWPHADVCLLGPCPCSEPCLAVCQCARCEPAHALSLGKSRLTSDNLGPQLDPSWARTRLRAA